MKLKKNVLKKHYTWLFNIKMVAHSMDLLLWCTWRHILVKVKKNVKHRGTSDKFSGFSSWQHIFLIWRLTFLNKLLAFLWERTISLSLQTSSYCRMSQISLRRFSKTRTSMYAITHSDSMMIFYPWTLQTFPNRIH